MIGAAFTVLTSAAGDGEIFCVTAFAPVPVAFAGVVFFAAAMINVPLIGKRNPLFLSQESYAHASQKQVSFLQAT